MKQIRAERIIAGKQKSVLSRIKMNKKLIFVVLIAIIACSSSYAQERVLYKKIDTTELFMQVYNPEKLIKDKKYPAMVFFFGGGWNQGTIEQFEPHANYFSKRGIVCFLVDYRVNKRQRTTPIESLKDAKSAIRFIREKAGRFKIDSSRVIAAGGSAGGHLAAASALIHDHDENTDDLTVSCIPNALVLFNPVIDNGPGGYGYDRVGDGYKDFSPIHNIKNGAPPTIIFLGTTDHLIPVETVKYYQKVMEKVESRCELFLYEGQGHGFFNHQFFEYYKKTVSEADRFLQSLGYLEEEPIIEIK